MNYTKIKKLIKIVLVVIVICLVGGSIYSYYNDSQSIKEYNKKIEMLDSLYKSDSLSYIQKYSKLDSNYKLLVNQRDSLLFTDSINSHISKIKIKTIYKDSIKEIYIENDDFIKKSNLIITKLQDSLINNQKTIRLLTNELANLKKQSSLTKHDTIIVKSNTTDNKKKLDLYGNIFESVTQSFDFNTGLEIGANYNIFYPFYIGASIKKTNISNLNKNYKLFVKGGINLFF